MALLFCILYGDILKSFEHILPTDKMDIISVSLKICHAHFVNSQVKVAGAFLNFMSWPLVHHTQNYFLYFLIIVQFMFSYS